jgi:hypothetical protein
MKRAMDLWLAAAATGEAAKLSSSIQNPVLLRSVAAAEAEARGSHEEESWALPMGPLLRLEQLWQALLTGNGEISSEHWGCLPPAPHMLICSLTKQQHCFPKGGGASLLTLDQRQCSCHRAADCVAGQLQQMLQPRQLDVLHGELQTILKAACCSFAYWDWS